MEIWAVAHDVFRTGGMEYAYSAAVMRDHSAALEVQIVCLAALEHADGASAPEKSTHSCRVPTFVEIRAVAHDVFRTGGMEYAYSAAVIPGGTLS